MSNKIAVLGAGAWGTALACAMAKAGHNVHLWGRDAAVLEEIAAHQKNSRYLGDIALADGLQVSTGLAQSVAGAQVILLVTPAQSIAQMVTDLSAIVTPDQIIIACAKGIDQDSGKTPAELISILVARENVGALSGPSFAKDVAKGLPTAVTLAFHDLTRAREFSTLLSSDNLRIYASDDLVGVELGGALKNVLALAVGAARGLQLGASAEAALIARGFGELRRVAVKMGAKPETLAGLSGLGDLVLTCSSTQSRNFSYGMALGRGDNLEGLPLAEGVFSAKIAAKLAHDNGVDAPILEAVADVLAEKITALEAVRQLLARPLKAENE
ncbi:MAG: NAD(P)-dependent glycerol-3-phosphate dehydrogenase [Boseongicola sp.]